MNIAIAGRARSGKDTVGQYLVETRGYRRVAFADALKEAALRVNPVIGTRTVDMWDLVYGEWEDHSYTEEVRLSAAVTDHGWEDAKNTPEVRRFLQELGATMRAVDPEIWIRAALKKVEEANDAGVPCVITDMRYPNELAAVRSYRHWHTIHIDRPGVPQLVHESEGAIGPEDTDFMIRNVGSVDDLHHQVGVILEDIDAIESARHANRVW
ncbi:hypothetical protein ACFUGD_01380 [Streptomyces sp. NPDC057217]|uniref:deoxynucleotide monophosphate kinase family protein n=1 Tax=Streptomyces sp. NPDC057217 TaxID=3346054 RepID=UPI00362ECC50